MSLPQLDNIYSRNSMPQTLWAFIRHFLKPYKGPAVLFMTLAILAGFWGPFNSMLLKYMINTLSASPINNVSLLFWPAVLLVLNFIVFDNITWRTIGYLNCKFEPVIKNKIISETFQFVLGSSHQFFQNKLSGRIASQINILADNVERILHQISPDFFRAASLLIIAFVTMFCINPLFFLVLALWFIAFSTFSIRIAKRLINLSDIHAQAESAISGQLVDSISNVNNVGIFARRSYEGTRLENALLIAQKTFQTKEIFIVKLHSVQGMLIAIMLACMIYLLIHLYAHQLVSVGDFALILGLTMEVGYTTWATSKQVDAFYQAAGKCKQSLTALIVPQEIQDKDHAGKLHIHKGEITFENVKFHYQGTEPLFQNKTVTIQAGQKVGLVGYSGGGKTTFVNLILRLFDVTDGRILIDNQDIRDITQESLRNNIAMIPQDPSLFHRTLMENIRYGKIEATDAEVIDAAKKAHAHEFINKLPQGYDTLVGERGIKLSGGQRQRIAIARAILKNAPILILDEATSQLDSVTESHIQASLWELMQHKTTIVIAHRLSTLLHMDRIMVFDQGNIVEEGTHSELLANNGLYKTLWDAQVGGFLPDKKSEDEE